MHESTFDYLKPTDAQVDTMAKLRHATKTYCEALEQYMPAGPDRTYAIRKVREVGMWANVAVTRDADGTPRQ
jgi:hypothetical protein